MPPDQLLNLLVIHGNSSALFSISQAQLLHSVQMHIVNSVSQKNPPPWFFLTFLQYGWEFLVQILHAYYMFLSMLDYRFLFSYLQLRRSYAILSATTIICSKCPPSVETLAAWSHLILHDFVTVEDNWIKICNLSYIGTSNRCVKFGSKIPNCFGKMLENTSVHCGQWWTFWTYGLN